MRQKITPLIITYNEAANIRRTMNKLTWAERIVVVDSGSADGTLEFLRRVPAIAVFHRPFDDFAAQCNFGLAKIETEWVLSLDADYELSDELLSELDGLPVDDETSGYRAQFVYSVFGHRLRGCLYPPRIVLYRKDRARYHNEGHGHRVAVRGKVRDLQGKIIHDDRKSLSRWMSSQQNYARREADHLLSSCRSALRPADKLRLTTWMTVAAVVPYVLIAKACWRSGKYGWHYALQRLLAEVLIALEILDRRLGREEQAHRSRSGSGR